MSPRIIVIIIILLLILFVLIAIVSYRKDKSNTIQRKGQKAHFDQMQRFSEKKLGMYELLVSAQCRPYQDWQCVGLYWSVQKNWPDAIYTRLLSCNSEKAHTYKYFGITPTVIVPDWSKHPESGDDYPPYNRPLAITEYLATSSPQAEFMVIIDPDTIIRKPLTDLPVSKGNPVAQRYDYLMDNDALYTIAKYYCPPDVAAKVQPIGMPMIIHRDDLKQLAPLWLDLTEKIRQEHKELAGWIAEMHSYCIAAAILGLQHTVRDDLASRPPYFGPPDDPYVLHYDIRHNCRGFTWDKRDYFQIDMLVGDNLMPEPIKSPNRLFGEVFKTLNDSLQNSI